MAEACELKVGVLSDIIAMASVLDGRPAMAAEIGKIAEVALYLWQKNWAERNGGNIVVNLTGFVDNGMRAMPAVSGPVAIGMTLQSIAGCWFYAKGTGKRMRDLARAPMDNGALIRVLQDGAQYEIVADKPVAPTSELPSHLAIHNWLAQSGNSEYKATLHTHPVELVAMSHSPRWLDENALTATLKSMIPETLAFAPLALGVVPYAMPSSLELARATLDKIRDYNVVLWEKHGTLAVGTDILDAFDQTDVLNKAACIYMSAKAMGFEPQGISQEDMAEMREVFHLPSRRQAKG